MGAKSHKQSYASIGGGGGDAWVVTLFVSGEGGRCYSDVLSPTGHPLT